MGNSGRASARQIYARNWNLFRLVGSAAGKLGHAGIEAWDPAQGKPTIVPVLQVCLNISWPSTSKLSLDIGVGDRLLEQRLAIDQRQLS